MIRRPSPNVCLDARQAVCLCQARAARSARPYRTSHLLVYNSSGAGRPNLTIGARPLCHVFETYWPKRSLFVVFMSYWKFIIPIRVMCARRITARAVGRARGHYYEFMALLILILRCWGARARTDKRIVLRTEYYRTYQSAQATSPRLPVAVQCVSVIRSYHVE